MECTNNITFFLFIKKYNQKIRRAGEHKRDKNPHLLY